MKNLLVTLIAFVGIMGSTFAASSLNESRQALVKDVWDSLEHEVTLERMSRLYEENIELIDLQFHGVGLEKVTEYWEVLRVKYAYGFVRYESAVSVGDYMYVHWTIMLETHATATEPSKKLMSRGLSEIRFTPGGMKAYYERDFLDPLKVVNEFPAPSQEQ